MDIALIARRVAEGLKAVDSTTTTITQGKHGPYLAGVFTMYEHQFVNEFKKWWEETYPSDFGSGQKCLLSHRYPEEKRAKCDLVLLEEDSDGTLLRTNWAIEFKKIALVGDNGKNNDYGLAKVISPYRKDRSLIHDVHRLRASAIAEEKAVIMYGFEFDKSSIQRAIDTYARIGVPDICSGNLKRVLKSVDPKDFTYSLEPIQAILSFQFKREALVDTEPEVIQFNGANRHPCGGLGRVVAWQISRSSQPQEQQGTPI